MTFAKVNIQTWSKDSEYSACAKDGPQDMEINYAAARHSWARQHAWQLFNFFPFPVGHPEHEHCILFMQGQISTVTKRR